MTSKRDNPLRFHGMEFVAGLLLKHKGMTRLVALIAIQAWNHFLANQLKTGDMEGVKKIIYYYDYPKGRCTTEDPSVFEEEHKVFLDYFEEKLKENT